MANPGSLEHESAAVGERRACRRAQPSCYLAGELRRDPLVSIHEIHPVVPEQLMAQGVLTLGGETEPGLLQHLRAESARNRHGVVGRAAVDEHDLVRPGYGGQAAADVRLLVTGEDHDAGRDAPRRGLVARVVRAQAEPGHRNGPSSQLK
jgi:hypothetical protein